jgi:hypothetical protein
MSWKPIDIAPRDGSRIVVAFRSPMTGAISAFVSRWAETAWEQESTRGDYDATGDVAFAWIDLPGDETVN